MTPLQLEEQNAWRPTNTLIQINPEKWGEYENGKLEPQACEYEGNWYYNQPAAMLEFGDRLPTKEQWEEIIEEGIELPLAGLRDWDNGQYYYQGTYGYYWSSTPYTTYSYHANFGSGGGNIANGSYRGNGFFVRCLKKLESDSSEKQSKPSKN